MSSVWITKESWDKVWAALHNIHIRMNFTVKQPSVALSGKGAAARINIDLPGINTGKSYNGPFAVTYSRKEKALIINPGWVNINGMVRSIERTVLYEIRSGILCLKAVLDEKGEILSPEYAVGMPAADNYPICSIDVREEHVTLEMFTVPPVIPYTYAKECPFAMKE